MSKKRDPVLQAVIIADSFDQSITTSSQSLLPICNVPVIEYTLETLSLSLIQQIFVCTSSEEVKDYFSNSKWSNSPVVRVISCQDVWSMGDILRDLDTKQIIQNDFILISGWVISNLNLLPFLGSHLERKSSDDNSIMTLVCSSSSGKKDKKYVIDTQTNQLLHYTSSIPFSTLKQHPDLTIKTLQDTQIDICSLEVLALFTENFDYQTREDFVQGILESDCLAKNIYVVDASTNAGKGGYAVPITTLDSYIKTSIDVMNRWCYPFTVDYWNTTNTNVKTKSAVNSKAMSGYTIQPHSVYLQPCHIDPTVTLKESVVVGSGSNIGPNTTLMKAVLGKGVNIGQDVVLERSCIGTGSVIHDRCDILKTMIGNGVTILDGAKLEGCVLEDGVVLKTGTELKGVKICKEEQEGEELGSVDGFFAYALEALDSDSDTDSNSELDYSEFEEEQEEEEADNDWEKEVWLTITRAFEESHTVDIAILELNTLKMAMNITFGDLRSVVVPAILGLLNVNSNMSTIFQVIKRWFPIIKRFIHSHGDQVHTLHLIANYMDENPNMVSKTAMVVKRVWMDEIVASDAVVEWYEQTDGRVKDVVKMFVEGLKRDDSESETESETASESESEDDSD